MSIYFLICTPIILGLLLSIFRMGRSRIELLAVCGGVIEFASALVIVFLHGEEVAVLTPYLHYDALGAWFLFITALLGFLGLLYSLFYLKKEEESHPIAQAKIAHYYALYHVFLLSMFVAVGANNVLLLWIAVEASTLASAFLVNFFDRAEAIEAAWRYMVVSTIALLLGLFGIFLFIAAVQYRALDIPLDWESIMRVAPLLDPSLIKLAFVFMLVGYGTKAGLAPLHNWLPDAHGQAPVPVSALLSGALLNVAILALLRFKGIVDITVGGDFSETLFLTFGTLSMVVGAVFILIQKQYKRMLAYSSIEHMGIIIFGFGLGGAASVAALLHTLYHSLAKSLVFYATGNIALRYHSFKIAKVTGLLRTLPLSGVLFIGGLLAVAGVPPFGTFLTEFAIFSSGIGTHPTLTIIAITALALAFVGIMKHLSAMCFGEGEKERGEFELLSYLPLLILFAALCVVSVFIPSGLTALLNAATLKM